MHWSSLTFLKPEEPPELPPGYEYYEGTGVMEWKRTRPDTVKHLLYLDDRSFVIPFSAWVCEWNEHKGYHLILNRRKKLLLILGPFWKQIAGNLHVDADHAEYCEIIYTTRRQASILEPLRHLARDG